MARLAELRKTAKDMGISKAVILRATTASALEKVIADAKSHNGNSKPRKKSAVAKKKTAAQAPAKKQTGRKNTARKNSGRKDSTPAKSKGAQAKRSSNSNGNGGRNTLDSIDFSVTDGWNPRTGSAPDRIIKCLKKFRGNRTKAFEALKGDVWDFVNKKRPNGEKHTKASAEAMLKYRISRTLWDFAMRTGQHESSTNRVEYGTGGTGQGVFKRAKAGRAQKASKPAAKKATAKAGRKPAAAKKPAQARARATRAKRGRPKGSKNRPKITDRGR
jgi:hypothetical protein